MFPASKIRKFIDYANTVSRALSDKRTRAALLCFAPELACFEAVDRAFSRLPQEWKDFVLSGRSDVSLSGLPVGPFRKFAAQIESAASRLEELGIGVDAFEALEHLFCLDMASKLPPMQPGRWGITDSERAEKARRGEAK